MVDRTRGCCTRNANRVKCNAGHQKFDFVVIPCIDVCDDTEFLHSNGHNCLCVAGVLG